MYHFILHLRIVLLCLGLAGFAALPSSAQTQLQASTVVAANTYNTSNAALAVDNSQETAAVLQAPALVGSAKLRVGFGATIAQGQKGILLLKGANGGLLDLSALGSMTIQTYRSTDPSIPIQSVAINTNTVTLALLPGSTDITQVIFSVTAAFDQLELLVGSLLTAATTVSVYTVAGTVAPLPVSLTAFSGKATAAGVALSWTTASEQHNDHFVVERATGTPETFRARSLVQGAGSSTQQHQYQFVDAQPSGLCYYRLRQVATDGTESFSPVVAVQAELLSSLLTYPTLATETLTVVGAGGAHLGIFNQRGQQVQLADVSASQPSQIDVRGLPSGVYFLRDAATGQHTRFEKEGGH